ncbi:ABC transporter permease [Halorientalis litorea]|jgi:molybdate/tungstate transport system permease protein|uniref:ABC transporter permease n=1 Tax=Halorientalis litorea TaxID=2931977 RepID=UPI001FF5D3BA|nr:ABC transporter permease [Halorientalis litorea]
MATDTDSRFVSGSVGRTPLVVAFVVAQAVAFAATYLAGRPTLYAYAVVVSTLGVAYAYESDVTAVAAIGKFAAVQVVAFVAAYVVGSTVLLVLYARPLAGVGDPFLYVLYVLVAAAGTAYVVEDGGFAVVTAAMGSVVVVALGLPLVLFVARQSPAAVTEKALDPSVHRVIYLGVYGPLLAALLSLLFGVPLAHLLSEGFAGQPLVESLVDLPLVVPHSVAGILILFGFGQGGAFPALSVLGTMLGMVLAMTFVSAPYAINATREAFETIDDRLEYASRAHGASRWETFRRVTAPLAARGMVTGGVLAWARAVSEFGAVAVVAYSVQFFYPPAGGRVTAQHAPVFVYNTYLQGGLEESGAVAFLLLAVSGLLFLVVRSLTNDGSVSGGMP